MLPTGALIENCPFESATTELFVPLIVTEAPDKGSPVVERNRCQLPDLYF